MASPDTSKEDKLTQALQDALRETFRMSFGIDIDAGQWAEKHFQKVGSKDIACMVELRNNGAKEGSFVLVFHFDFIRDLLKKFGAPMDDALVKDTVEEIANMVLGVMKTNLNAAGNRYQPAFPHAIKKDQPLSNLNFSEDCLCLPFYSGTYENEALLSLVRM